MFNAKNNQVAEMAEAIFQNCNCCLFYSEAERIADFVINEQGYRKASDGVEVRHGEWQTHCDTFSGGLNCYRHSCSVCDYTYKTVVPIGYDYCPHCGAKMDGERKDDGT